MGRPFVKENGMRLCSVAIAALLLASPAAAAPLEDATCLVGRLSPADVETIVGTTTAGGSTETLARLRGPLEACSAGNWSRDRQADAAAYAIGLVTRDTLRERLGASGVDAAALDRWFARQSDAFRTTAFVSMSDADMDAAFATLVGHEVSAEAMERNGRTIGGYVGALVIMERIGRGLGL